jgi:Holliday junction resolvase RusA-like endonuclease
MIWGDDSQVVELIASKDYDDDHPPGAFVTIQSITDWDVLNP